MLMQGRDRRWRRGARVNRTVVCVGLLVRVEDVALRVDLDIGRRDAVLDDLLCDQALAACADRVERVADDVERNAQIDQRAQHHVARRAARAVEMEVLAAHDRQVLLRVVAGLARHGRTARRAILTAATAAPTPLSMLTTVMPGAHAASSAPSATRPSIETP